MPRPRPRRCSHPPPPTAATAGPIEGRRKSCAARRRVAAARARHGWTAEEARTKYISDTAATFNTEHFFRAATPLLKGERESITLELVHFTGPIEVSTRLARTTDEGNFFVSVLRDISSRKSSELEKVQTVSTVSHELRTPLTSIHGALRLLKAGVVAELDEKTQSVVDIAARNTDRLLSIVNDILDLEKINSNKMDFSIVEMDIDLEVGGMSRELFIDNIAYWDSIMVKYADFVFSNDE